MKLKNKNKQIFLIFILFALSLGSIGLIFEFFYSSYNIKQSTLSRANEIMTHREKMLNNFLTHSKELISAIRNSDSFKDFLKNKENKKLIKEHFKISFLANEDFMQFRFIDKNGDEVIRIDRSKKDKNKLKIIKNLQNKANRYYFKNSINKNDGEVWFSSFDLNMEHGKVQIPFEPTIRTIYPIRVNGEFQGILIINHCVKKLINQISAASIFNTILVDEDGYIINHYDKNKNWGKFKKEKYNLKTEFPKNHLNIINNKSFLNSEIASRKLEINLFKSLYLIYKVDEKYLKEQFKKEEEKILIEIVFFIIISLIFSSLIIRVFGNIFNDYEQQKILNERLELASNVSKIGFWDFNSKSKMVNLSKSLKELLGNIKYDKMFIDDFLFLILEEKDAYAKKEFYNSIETKTEFLIKEKIIINSEVRFFELVGKHFYDNEGNHTNTIGNVHDITQKYLADKLNVKVTKQAKEFKKLFDRFDENVIASATDIKGIITYTSKAFCEISGFSKDELLGSPQNIVRHPDSSPEVFKELWETIKSGNVWQGELKNKTKNGGIYWVDAHIYPEFDEEQKIIGYSAIRHDITAKKQVEKLSKKTNESIEFSRFIQHSLLPSNKSIDGCIKDKFIIWEPKDIVGGDIYTLAKSQNKNECLIMLIDCTGHGVPGAFVTMLVKAIEKQYLEILKNKKDHEVNLSDILNFYNKMMKTILNQNNKVLASNVGFDGGILHFDNEKRIVKFAGASNNLLFYDKEKINLIKGDRVSIGFKNSKDDFNYKIHELKVEDGMKFYLYSDGFIDQIGGDKGFSFGRKRLISILGNNINKSMTEQKEILLDELKKYQKDYERVDDITVMGFET